ncbi:hypothetical protein [Micavibrio aeruginosavorus]|uniref:Putative membrane protein n=1 Tax=Micavibrio aeruginosavorus (strain ARL-13) TaxID=856793 RepID=G2KPN2_MICAA|nr:hypothetical protein [Micavibrio aeruginosavorus]AEP09851.1 putative membrane protein [Micavibrio aeruginosavorus ARL-13]
MLLSWPLIQYVLTAAVRDRIVLALLLVVAVGASLSLFLGSAALIEDQVFALVFSAGGLRFAAVAGLVLFVVFHMRRSFDSKDVDYLLSRPISRTGFLVSHAVAFSVLAVAVAAVVGGTLMAMVPAAIGAGHALWVFSLAVELIIVVNVALFFSMVLPGAAAGTLAVFGFYVLARIIGQLLGIANKAFLGDDLSILGILMNAISVVIPRLDLMAQTTWLVYGTENSSIGYGFVALQGLVFTGLVLVAGLVDLRRRQF